MTEHHHVVFLGGLHRSGTTPLARALASHPEVTGLRDTGVTEDEGHHLQDVYPKLRNYGGVGRFANAEDAHLTETSPLISDQNGDRLLASWRPYWDLTKPYVLEKSPQNLIMGRYLQAQFPDSALVVVIRHPIIVSLATQKWMPAIISRRGHLRVGLAGLVAHWFRAHEILNADAPHLRRLHVLRYEDLIAEPVEELAKIQRFLGLKSPIPHDQIQAGKSNRYTETWASMRSGGLLARRRRREIEARFGEEAARYGYDISDPELRSEWLFEAA